MTFFRWGGKAFYKNIHCTINLQREKNIWSFLSFQLYYPKGLGLCPFLCSPIVTLTTERQVHMLSRIAQRILPATTVQRIKLSVFRNINSFNTTLRKLPETGMPYPRVSFRNISNFKNASRKLPEILLPCSPGTSPSLTPRLSTQSLLHSTNPQQVASTVLHPQPKTTMAPIFPDLHQRGSSTLLPHRRATTPHNHT
ncbi:Hypothetical protein, putative [Bodo saltans]|uniref:Uncharacterized protein n=1 Tax=Bodo saltans TaxID=75058 RepID=A0A0S4JM13_BODSA|nr:Hypothetical protein, putative [Bodo saltans]|eukprot:CUG91674.1 Hypothetical protein, putative [Bodo saltans]